MANTRTPPTKEELEALRAEGKTREEIAAIYNVALSQVKRWISSLKVAKKIVRREPSQVPQAVRPAVVMEDDGLTVMEKAKRILGDRLTEKRGVGYLLDGRVVNTDVLLQAAGVKYKNHDT